MIRSFPAILVLLVPVFSFATDLLPGFQEELLVYGLNHPVAAEYAPDGRLFILEKGGTIRIFKNGVLLKKPFLRMRVNDIIERGLLGLALDPNFSTNHHIYIYRTTAVDSPKNRVERFTAVNDTTTRSTRKILLSGIRSDNGQHNAGGLRFGPDGKLYISTGDGGLDKLDAQDLAGLNGKILRINPDGSVPSDNPFIGRIDARPEIWCYGLRNPWRFAVHPQSGMVAIGDVGSAFFEEINVGRAGGNFGWPVVEGVSADSSYINPCYSYGHVKGREDAAINGGSFYTANQFPSRYRDRLFITDYIREFIKALTLDQSGNLLEVEAFATNLPAPVHLTQGPNGTLMYVSIKTGEIRLIRYVGGKNRPPVAIANASKEAGKLPLTVVFSSSGSKDPDGDPIGFNWDFGDGSLSTAANPQHTYSRKGVYFVLLTVRDNKKGVGYSQSIRITVGNEPPAAIILRPSSGFVVHPGQVVDYAGKGRDPEDGTLNPRFLIWSAELHHNSHTHPFLQDIRGRKGTFVVPEIHDTGTFFFRLQLEVVDSSGVRTSTSVDLPFLP